MKSLARSLVESVPLGPLPPSAAVDALHMAAGTKKAMRTCITHSRDLKALDEWTVRHGLALIVDDEGYACIAADRSLAEIVLEVDQKVEPHAVELGRLLGYPSCCCAFVAARGERLIDELAGDITRWSFIGDYRLIDPTQYVVGRSLVCHLPCSPTCDSSLELALTALGLVRLHLDSIPFRRWEAWLDVLQTR